MPTSSTSIVITGLGLAAPLGLSADEVWTKVRHGHCGMGPMPAMESALPPNSVGGQAPELPTDFLPTQPREVRYIRWTINAALKQAGLSHSNSVTPSSPLPCRERSAYPPGEGRPSPNLTPTPTPDLDPAGSASCRPLPPRTALVLGTTLHGMRAGGTFLRTKDPSHLKTFLAGSTASLASEGLAFSESFTTCSACSSSLGAVALAVTLLETGKADYVLAGGYDTISEYAWAGFNALRLVTPENLRPFTKGRSGMKLAEGYGLLLLERASTAQSRGAKPIATVAGWGESADAFHLTRPDPEGKGANAAMQQALRSAKIHPQDLGLVAAHATGTPDNDAGEAAALKLLLNEHPTPVVGFKSHLGHTLGGAGAVELILSALAIRDQILPPTANVTPEGNEYPHLNVTSGPAKPAPITHTLNTSLGFGGANTCVVLSSPDAATSAADASPPSKSVITGVGVLLPGAIGNDAFISAVCGMGVSPMFAASPRDIPDSAIEALLNARRTRRMSPYVKLSLAAASLAIQDAALTPEQLVSASALLGTTHGSSSYCYDYYEQLVREGVLAANPMLFAEGVPNAAAAQLSLMLGLKGACQTIIGTRSAGTDALRLARLRIASGASDRVLVIAAEEPHFSIDTAYRACKGPDAKPSMSAAVAFVVESETTATARGARIYNTLHTSIEPQPFSLAGDAFSVEPLLALAASLLQSAVGAACPR